MLTTAPHLSTSSPSPTTVQFCVSNASLRQTVTARVVFGLSVLLRVAVAGVGAAFLATKFFCSSLECNGWWGLSVQVFTHQLLVQPWELVVPVCAAALYLCCRRYHKEETLLVIRSLGLQTSTSSNSYLASATTRFIPTSQVQDIFIHEAFIGFEVRYYLAIVVEGEGEVTVVFPNLLPKLAIVEEVWRGARECLFESRPKVSKATR